MRFYEIATIKPIKPLNPAQARMHSLKVNADRARDQVHAERERQRKQRETERQSKALQHAPTLA